MVTPPLPTIPFRESPGYKGHEVLALNAALIAITTVIVGARFYARGFMAKALGIDDLFAFLSYGCVLALSASEIRSVGFGSGAHILYVPAPLVAKFFETLVNNTMIYFFGTGLMRLSIVAFLPRLAKDLASPLFLRTVYAVGVLIIAQTLGCFIYRLTECSPISDIWKVPTTPGLRCVTAQQENSMMIGHQALGIIADCLLLGLPIWTIYNTMMFSKGKVQILLIFSVWIFVLATGIVRIVMLKTLLFLEDPTFHMSTIGPWTDLEGHVGLWCASFPALRPLLRIISIKLGIHSNSYLTPAPRSSAAPPSDRWGRAGRYTRNGSGADAATVDNDSERAIVSKPDKPVEMDPIAQLYKKTEPRLSVESGSAGKQLYQD